MKHFSKYALKIIREKKEQTKNMKKKMEFIKQLYGKENNNGNVSKESGPQSKGNS